jgi:hypothetical protein
MEPGEEEEEEEEEENKEGRAQRKGFLSLQDSRGCTRG